MTAKYSAERSSDSDRWDSDVRHVLGTWSTNPFHDHRHSHETVWCRVVVEYTPGVGADLILEARSEDSGHFEDDWASVEIVEVREYGARHERAPEARWLK